MPLFNWTGNPWVDAGIAAIQEWSKKKSPDEISLENLKEISTALVDIYLSDAWRSSLYSVFPNHPATQSYGIKTKGITEIILKDNLKNLRKRQRGELCNLFDSLLNNTKPLSKSGNCIACGRRDVREQRNRMHIPLTGYEGSHFFSFKADGADYCDACTFAVQCSPLVYYACGKLLLLHSGSVKIMRFWAKRCIAEIQKQIATRNYSGCFNEQYANATNALFHIMQDIILSYDERWIEENASIRLYHFTNYNQGADLDIYDLPAPVFRFLAYIRPHPKYRDWLKVIRKGYGKDVTGKSEGEYKELK
jgi:CRISPR-associated protein Cst1